VSVLTSAGNLRTDSRSYSHDLFQNVPGCCEMRMTCQVTLDAPPPPVLPPMPNRPLHLGTPWPWHIYG
jgi:hypothetical protein